VFTATIENLCSAAGKGRETVQFGAHLPLIDLGTGLPKVDDLIAYARRARETGFRYLCALRVHPAVARRSDRPGGRGDCRR